MDLPINYDKASSAIRRKARIEYQRLQEDKCWWCGNELTSLPPKYITNKKISWHLFPKYFLKHPIHLQHNHKTSMTEGAVHAYCNAVMWQYHGK